MKINRKDLRQMIFEAVLREQDADGPDLADREARKKARKERADDRKAKKAKKAPAAAPAAPAAPAAAPAAEPAAEPAAAAPAKKKAPNEKIRQVQRLLNSFLGEQDKQLAVNGYWNSNAMDPVMKKVMSGFSVPNPGRSWVKMATELSAAPTLQGLIGYLIKKDTARSSKAEDKEQKPFDSSSLTPQKDDAKPEENGLKYPSTEGIKSSTPDEIKQNTALLIGLFGSFPAGGAPKNDPNKSWNNYTDDEVNTMRNRIFKIKPDLKGKSKKELAIEFLKNNINYNEVKGRPGDDIKTSRWKDLLGKIEKVAEPFDLGGLDGDYPDGLQASIKLALKSANLKNGDKVNESKVIYGKSHATLLRERYWGRY